MTTLLWVAKESIARTLISSLVAAVVSPTIGASLVISKESLTCFVKAVLNEARFENCNTALVIFVRRPVGIFTLFVELIRYFTYKLVLEGAIPNFPVLNNMPGSKLIS